MWLSDLSIRRPVLSIVMAIILVLFGVMGYSRLSVREYPDIDPPIISVSTIYEGASPEVISSTITEPLEDELTSIEGIKTLSSTSGEGNSLIIIEFELYRDVNIAAQDVRDRVFRARGRLPDSVEEPVIVKQDSDARPILWLGLGGEGFSQLQLTDYADRYIIDQLQVVPGVGNVVIGGSREYAMRLWLDPLKMAARQVTALDVRDALFNENIELPSGRVEGDYREFTIRTLGEMKAPKEFNRLIVKTVDGTPVRLEDIGRAEVGARSDRSMVRMNGKPAVGLGVVKQSKANTLEVAEGINTVVQRLQANLPPGMTLEVGYDSSRFIDQSIKEVKESLLLAVVLVSVVIFLFLGTFRAAFIPVVAIPVSLIATFYLMDVMHFSINTLTLLAMTLAIGLVVDDAIVVLENITRHIEKGMAPMEAAFKGIREVAFAVIATTLVLVAIFTPLAFMTGVVGRLFSEFALALAGAVIISTFVALSLSPMLCSRILSRKVDGKIDVKEGGAQISTVVSAGWNKLTRLTHLFRNQVDALRQVYLQWLDWAMAHKIQVTSGCLVMLLLTGVCYQFVAKEFLPQEDRGFLLTAIRAPEGATLAYTDKAVHQAEAVFANHPDIKRYFSVIAFSGNGVGSVNEAIMFVTLKDIADRQHHQSQSDILAAIQPKMFNIAEAQVFPFSPPSGPAGAFNDPIQLVVKGFNVPQLAEVSDKIVARLQAMSGAGGLFNIQSNLKLNKPQVELMIDRGRASVLGVSVRDVSSTLQILMGGLDLSTFQLNNKRYDVVAQLAPEYRKVPEKIEQISVESASGQLVPLANFTHYQESVAPKSINHYNRLKAVTITSGTWKSLGDMLTKIQTITEEELPSDMMFEWAGESREFFSAQSVTTIAFLLAMLVVFLVLSAQFESFVHPLVVMLTVPLAICGGFITIFMAGTSLNVYSQIGMILLIGLVTKNGILIVEYANSIRQENPSYSTQEAVMEACAIRFRPILMTAVSTIFSAFPLVMGLGAGAQSRQSLGLTVIGGMMFATLLSLFVIPIAYEKINRRMKPTV